MEVNGKRLLVCNCNGTMPLDGKALAAACAGGAPSAGSVEVHTLLCRTQLARFEEALRQNRPVIVACTQEAPLFAEARAEAGLDTDIGFVNIREHAGWSDEAELATPKIAALIAEAALDVPAPPTVTVKSAGVTLIYGRDGTAIEAAQRISDRLDCTVLLSNPSDIVPPRLADVPIFKGTLAAVTGHVGAFEVVVDGYAPVIPSSRGALQFERPRDGAFSTCDLILDLSGGPALFPAADRRDGYFRADPGDAAAVERALFELVEMVGEFEKPAYVAYDAALCVHGRAGRRGCTACLDACPTGAIASAGDIVDIDAFVCAGCGDCVGVCPTGAVSYTAPSREFLLARLQTVLATYLRAGGRTPVLLIHDETSGEEIIDALARQGNGLPAHVIPFRVNTVAGLGVDFFVAALAQGATRLYLLAEPPPRSRAADLANRLLAGLGYGPGRAVVVAERDPAALGRLLRAPPPAAPPAAPAALHGNKRRIAARALQHLHAAAPDPPGRVPLDPGSPFGTIAVDRAACTLCLTCVAACPTGALLGTPDRARLSIIAEACVQCSLCAAACPEHAIRLDPGFDFSPTTRIAATLREAPDHPQSPPAHPVPPGGDSRSQDRP